MTIAPGIFGTPMMFGMPKEVQDALAISVPFLHCPVTSADFRRQAVHIATNDMLGGETIGLDRLARLAPRQ